MKFKTSILLLSCMFIVGCNNNHSANASNSKQVAPLQSEHQSKPTQYKVLDLTMGMNKKDILSKGFDCSGLSYSGKCEIYTNPESTKNSYQKISNNGTVNNISVFLDKNDLVYRITISSRHTANNEDIEQFKQTLSKLIDNNSDVEESVEVMESNIFVGAHFVLASFTDKARKIVYESQKNNKADSAASDIKNFGK